MGQNHLGKELALGEIKFNPFTLLLDAGDIAIPGRAGPMVALSHLRVQPANVSTLSAAGLTGGAPQ